MKAMAHLCGRKVLVVEDDFMIADSMAELLRDEGVEVIGPVASVRKSLELIAATLHIDAAIIDVNLRGEFSYDVADELLARGISFAFMTGYDEAVIPARFSAVRRFQKPARPLEIAALLLA